MKKPSDNTAIDDVMQWSSGCQEHFFPWRLKSAETPISNEIAEAGVTESHTGYRLERRCPRFHLLVFTLRGAGDVYSDANRRQVKREQLLLVPAGQPFGYVPARSPWEFVWFHLPDEECWSHLRGRGMQVRKTAMTGPIERLSVDFLRESRGRGETAQKASSLYAELMALYIHREIGDSDEVDDTGIGNLLNQLWDKVGKDLKRDWTVELLAYEMGVSMSHLHRLVRQMYGTSPMKMVTRIRMERAQELLIMHDVSIGVVAELVGYRNQFAFAIAFKRFSGVTPGQFRKRR